MNEFNLSKLNAKVGDNCVFVSNLAVRYQSAATPEERMAMAIKMENAATMLRIAAERLATETKNVYGVEAMKKAELHLVTNLSNPNKFDGRISGDIDLLAKMIVASLTYHPELFKKTFEEFLNRIYGGKDND